MKEEGEGKKRERGERLSIQLTVNDLIDTRGCLFNFRGLHVSRGVYINRRHLKERGVFSATVTISTKLICFQQNYQES